MSKPTHVKPSFYAYYFQPLKEISFKYGYNLVLHGSLNRDMDLIAIPWQETIGDVDQMILEMTEYLGGKILQEATATTHHGRKWYVINLNRQHALLSQPDEEGFTVGPDPQWYLDISVTPAINI